MIKRLNSKADFISLKLLCLFIDTAPLQKCFFNWEQQKQRKKYKGSTGYNSQHATFWVYNAHSHSCPHSICTVAAFGRAVKYMQ